VFSAREPRRNRFRVLLCPPYAYAHKTSEGITIFYLLFFNRHEIRNERKRISLIVSTSPECARIYDNVPRTLAVTRYDDDRTTRIIEPRRTFHRLMNENVSPRARVRTCMTLLGRPWAAEAVPTVIGISTYGSND